MQTWTAQKTGRQKTWFVGYVGWRGWPIAGVSCDVGTEIRSNWQQLTIYAGCGKVQQAWVCLLQLRSVAHIGMSIADIFPCGTTIIFLVFGKNLSLGWSYSILFTIILYHVYIYIHLFTSAFDHWNPQFPRGPYITGIRAKARRCFRLSAKRAPRFPVALAFLRRWPRLWFMIKKIFQFVTKCFATEPWSFPSNLSTLEIPFPSFGTLEHDPSLIYYRMITFQFATSAAVFWSEHF